MNQTDKGPEGNEEVCSTTEVQYAEKNGNYPDTNENSYKLCDLYVYKGHSVLLSGYVHSTVVTV